MDIWTTIKVLRNRGVSIRQISKELRISRNTVKRYINTQHPPHYEKSVEYLPKSKWEKYRKEIMQMYYKKRFFCLVPTIIIRYKNNLQLGYFKEKPKQTKLEVKDG